MPCRQIVVHLPSFTVAGNAILCMLKYDELPLSAFVDEMIQMSLLTNQTYCESLKSLLNFNDNFVGGVFSASRRSQEPTGLVSRTVLHRRLLIFVSFGDRELLEALEPRLSSKHDDLFKNPRLSLL